MNKFVLSVASLALVLPAGCATQPLLPKTNTYYTVGLAGGGVFNDVVTVEFMGNWVLLDGRRLIPRERIDYIRADREKPEKKN